MTSRTSLFHLPDELSFSLGQISPPTNESSGSWKFSNYISVDSFAQWPAFTTVPHPEPLTWRNTPQAHAYILLYFFMAYLTRRPRTYAFRLFLLPLAVLVILHCTVQYRIMNPLYGWYNWLRGLAACACISKVIRFAVVPQGMLKLGEERLQDSALLREDDGHEVTKKREAHTKGILPPCFFDAFEVGLSARGIGWQFARGVHVPRARRASERHAYLRRTVPVVLRNFLLADLFDSSLELLPGVTVNSGTTYLPSLPPIPRYLVGTIIHVLAGIFIISGIEMWYDIVSLIGVGLFQQSPSLWPPIHDKPWLATSLHEFWSKGWHQILRDTFLVLGGYPGRWIAGDLGMLFGTFIASGLFHEVGFYLGGESIDTAVIVFFVAQAFGILAEKLYKTSTGRRVGGWLGRMWVAVFLVGLGQLCTNSWIARGAGGRALVPPAVSPARRLLFPVLRSAAARYLA
ncbi:hypothetical protein OH77DRAFT_1389701 [Trametes cingulata]|nr:hypothetical protein OH77DRAFT_1389701 [Trametes cingulata]